MLLPIFLVRDRSIWAHERELLHVQLIDRLTPTDEAEGQNDKNDKGEQHSGLSAEPVWRWLHGNLP